MTDGIGTTEYSYVPPGAPGALSLSRRTGPLPDSEIGFAYDALGRVLSQTLQGSGPETFTYDAIGRLTGHGSDLGAFSFSYLGQTGQITERQLSASTLQTSWSYLDNLHDRRLAVIENTGLSSGQFSNFAFNTEPEGLITGVETTSDAASGYPVASTQGASYNDLNQLVSLSGQTLSYDANGNLLSDGQRTYSWDAENRLIGIGYPGQPGKATAFAYDGAGQRVLTTRTPAGGGSAVSLSYVWCGGTQPC
uniref:hypothetical protein n=1 Tax=Paenirhodobacter enshiensis TaxID=1105367 RepID=UPI0035AFE897